jgi:hypothetical protein
MAPPTAVFGIHSSTLNTIVELLVLILAVFWLALIYWTYADARRRVADPLLVGCATAAALFPFIGTVVYMIVRPPEFLEDVRERELEIQAAEARLAEIGMHSCPHCDGEIEKDFLRCPHCLRKLKDPCVVCARPLDPRWRICPFCEADVGSPAPAARRVRRSPPSAQSPVSRPPSVPAGAIVGARQPSRAARAQEPSSSRSASGSARSRSLSGDPPPRSLSGDPPPRSLSDDPPPRSLSDDPPPRSLSDDPPPRPSRRAPGGRAGGPRSGSSRS